jgi:hypothetical protein
VLRLAGVQGADGKPLSTGAQVCMAVDEDASARICFPAQRAAGEAEGGGLDVTVSDLTTGRVVLSVEQRVALDAAADVWSLMASGKLQLAPPLQASLFCRGVEAPPLTGHVPVGRVRIYLDRPDAPAPERCP